MNCYFRQKSQRQNHWSLKRVEFFLQIARSLNRVIKRKRRQALNLLQKNSRAPKTQIKSFRILQQQFIEHCAVIIQSRFKGFIQRKKYRQFLPIYRRLRQLIQAIAQGWKTRKILKLNTIKNQINLIKEKQSKNQLSLLRIGKRELIDEIERYKKKGKWVEQYKKQLMLKKKIQVQDRKQNLSMFANIKPISIKNIFKKQMNAKVSTNNKKIKDKQVKIKCNKIQLQQRIKVQKDNLKQINLQKSTHKQQDQMVITPKQNFYSLLQQKLYEEQQTKPHQKTNISKYLKKIVKKTHDQQKKQVKIQNKKIKRQQSKLSIDKKVQNKSQKDSINLNLDNLSINSDYNTIQSNRSKKIKITLSKRSVQTQSLSSHRQVRSQFYQSSPLVINSKYSTQTFQNNSENIDFLDQNVSFCYRNNYLIRAMSLRKKSDKEQGKYKQSCQQIQRYTLVEINRRLY